MQTSKTSSPDFIVIEVIDKGPGVKPTDLNKLKNPFFTTKRDHGGTGLGLSISEKIVFDHMGIMEFVSQFGKGLSVKILLPFPNQKRISKGKENYDGQQTTDS